MSNFAREDDIRTVLEITKTFAVVGLSAKMHQPSHRVSRYLKSQGYRIIPVNPNNQQVLGEQSYPDLASVPETFETVLVFRKPEHILDIVRESVELGVKNIWLQEGVVHQEAARQARDAGIRVVMDRCTYKEHSRLLRLERKK